MSQKQAASKLARVVRAFLDYWRGQVPPAQYRALERALEDYDKAGEAPLEMELLMGDVPERKEGQVECPECGKPFWPKRANHVYCHRICRHAASNRRHNPLRDRRRKDNRH